MKLLRYLIPMIAVLLLLSACNETTDPTAIATPQISPNGGTFTTAQTVTITCATEGATIKYTVDNSNPATSTDAITYIGAFILNSNTTIKAIAMKEELENSEVASAVFSIELATAATPQISPNGGTFTAPQTVTISSATVGATIKYTIDGTEPTLTNGTPYIDSFVINSNKTIKAIALKSDLEDSAVTTAVFKIFKEMVSVTGATFTMGRTIGTGFPDELPVHAVTLTKDFYIGKYEVRQSEWTAIMGSNPSEFLGMDRPVEKVSFYSVLVYCNKRSIAEGLDPVYTISGSTNPTSWGTIPTTNNATWNSAECNWNANGYRLPSEAEWEFSARGTSNTPNYEYSGSNTIGDVAWYSVNSGTATHEIGTKDSNGIGIFDMSGNVQEWVWDWHSLTYYASSPSVDPYGPATGTDHVIRGGSWEQDASYSRVAFRNNGTPEKGDQRVLNSRLGFRIVRNAN